MEKWFGRKEFWNPAQWTKYSFLELIFSHFLNKILVLLPEEPVLPWYWKGFWPKDVLLTCWYPEVALCWGKVILLLLPCFLCVCGIVLMKSACGVHPPPPLPYDAGGPPWKHGIFLLNVVSVSLVSLCRTSWYFWSIIRLVYQFSVKFCLNNSLWLSKKMLAFSFNICLNLCSFIKALRKDKYLL